MYLEFINSQVCDYNLSQIQLLRAKVLYISFMTSIYDKLYFCRIMISWRENLLSIRVLKIFFFVAADLIIDLYCKKQVFEKMELTFFQEFKCGPKRSQLYLHMIHRL